MRLRRHPGKVEAVKNKSAGRSLNFGEWGRQTEEALANYNGDSYLVDSLMENDRFTREAAQAEVQSFSFLKSWLEYDGIKEILVDRYASRALLKAILERRGDVIDMLIAELHWLKVAKKRGPKGKVSDGKHLYERVLELRDGQGLSFGKIAKQIYGDPAKRNLAAAHYDMGKKRLPPKVAAPKTQQ